MDYNVKLIFCGLIFTFELFTINFFRTCLDNVAPQIMVTDTVRIVNELNADKQGKHTGNHFSVQTKVSPFYNDSAIRECLPEERLKLLQTYCNGISKKNETSGLKKIVSGLLVDDVNKVLVCLHAKAGCSTWKIILANNTSDQLLNRSPEELQQSIHFTLGTYGLKSLSDFSNEAIKYKLNHYYKFMVVRHPFDRLRSVFMDKFVLGHEFTHTYGRLILSRYHADLPESTQRKGNISFSDLIHLMQDGYQDSHWDGPYHIRCNPCLIDYDRIVKLETQQSDSEYVIFNKLKGRSFGTAAKQHSKPENVMLAKGKLLQQFANCTSDQLDFLFKRLQMDFNMFGYSFDRQSLQAKCGDVNSCC